MTSEDRWAKVGELLTARLRERGMNQSDLADASGLSRETVRPFTKGVPNRRNAHTRAQICRAVGWSHDSIDRILAGKRPALSEAPHDVDRRLRELERQNDYLEAQVDEIDALRSTIEELGKAFEAWQRRLVRLEGRRSGGSEE